MTDPFAHLNAVQDALLTELKANAPSKTAIDLGWPSTLQPRHIWIEGAAQGTPDYDLSNGVESGQQVTLTVSGIVQAGMTYADLRARLTELWDVVTAAVLSVTPAHADHAEFGLWRIDEGISTDLKTKQLGFSREVTLTRWL